MNFEKFKNSLLDFEYFGDDTKAVNRGDSVLFLKKGEAFDKKFDRADNSKFLILMENSYYLKDLITKNQR